MSNVILYNYRTNTFDQIEAIDPAATLFALVDRFDLHWKSAPRGLPAGREWLEIRTVSISEYKTNMWNIAIEATDNAGEQWNFRATCDTI